jgi:hypothetical protein
LTGNGQVLQISRISVTGVVMWMVTREEAVEMYARYWAARFGNTAGGSARKMADALKLKGDLEGQNVWNAVADAIDRHRQEKRTGVRH